MRSSNLESLVGEHILSGVELTTGKTLDYYGDEADCNILLFRLDDITYELREDVNDGYRSYCNDVEVSERVPKYVFPGIKVTCSMMGGKWDAIEMVDCETGLTILEAGTSYSEDYYPYCHFAYYPENMACNQLGQ